MSLLARFDINLKPYQFNHMKCSNQTHVRFLFSFLLVISALTVINCSIMKKLYLTKEVSVDTKQNRVTLQYQVSLLASCCKCTSKKGLLGERYMHYIHQLQQILIPKWNPLCLWPKVSHVTSCINDILENKSFWIIWRNWTTSLLSNPLHSLSVHPTSPTFTWQNKDKVPKRMRMLPSCNLTHEKPTKLLKLEGQVYYPQLEPV